MIRSRWTKALGAAVTIKPPFEERAKAVMLRSISPASRTFTALVSNPSVGAADWMAPNCPIPDAMAGCRSTATRLTSGAICLSSSSHLPLRPYSNIRKPVALPPGRARLSTNPAPTGSMRSTNTMGKVRLTSSNGTIVVVPVAARMTSGASAASSAACLRRTSASVVAQRMSNFMLRPSVQPNCSSVCRNAPKRARYSGSSAAPATSKPMVRIRSDCSAITASGHAMPALPSTRRKFRRLMSASQSAGSILQVQTSTIIVAEFNFITETPVLSLLCVGPSRIADHGEAGALFDHLIGTTEERRRYDQPKPVRGLQIDYQLELGRLLDRQIGRLGPAQNLVDVVAGSPKQVRRAWPVGHQPTGLNVLSKAVHRRHARTEREVVDANTVGVGERVRQNVKSLRPRCQRFKYGSDITRAANFYWHDFEADCLGRGLDLALLQRRTQIACLTQYRQPSQSGHNLTQKFKAFACKVDRLDRETRNVSSRTSEACNHAVAGRICRQSEHDRNCRSHMLGNDGAAAHRHDNVYLQPNEFGRDVGVAFAPPFRPAILDRDGSAVDPTEFLQALQKSGGPSGPAGGRARPQKSNGGQLRCWLSSNDKGPCSAVLPISPMNARRLIADLCPAGSTLNTSRQTSKRLDIRAGSFQK